MSLEEESTISQPPPRLQVFRTPTTDDQGGNADLHIFDEEEEDYKEPTPLEMIGLTEEQQTAFANLSSSDLQNFARLLDTVQRPVIEEGYDHALVAYRNWMQQIKDNPVPGVDRNESFSGGSGVCVCMYVCIYVCALCVYVCGSGDRCGSGGGGSGVCIYVYVCICVWCVCMYICVGGWLVG